MQSKESAVAFSCSDLKRQKVCRVGKVQLLFLHQIDKSTKCNDMQSREVQLHFCCLDLQKVQSATTYVEYGKCSCFSLLEYKVVNKYQCIDLYRAGKVQLHSVVVQIYKSTKCNDMMQTGYCPRGQFCAFAHIESKSDGTVLNFVKMCIAMLAF